MSTPEGDTKKLLKSELRKVNVYAFTEAVARMNEDKAVAGYYFMPAASGMGEAGVGDFVMCIMGQYIEVEAKAEGKDASDLQALHGKVIKYVRGEHYVVAGVDQVIPFVQEMSFLISAAIAAITMAEEVHDLRDKHKTGGVVH